MNPASSASNGQTYYLYASPPGQSVLSSNGVFYKATGEQLANTLCRLFCKEYSSESMGTSFLVKCMDEVDLVEQILFDEALDWLDVYDVPDPSVYDPPPSKEVMTLVEYARRAHVWESKILAHTGHHANSSIDESADQSSSDAARGMPAIAPANGIQTGKKTERRDAIEAFIKKLANAGRKITRTDIWTVAGYKDSTEFERYQRHAARTTASATDSFNRVLSMHPDVFIAQLEKRMLRK